MTADSSPTSAPNAEPSGRKPAAIIAVGVAFALVFAAIGLRQTTPPPSGLEGKMAPTFALPLLTATPQPEPERVTVPSKSRPTLLHFWGPSCAPCVEHAPVVAKLHAEGVKSGAYDVVTVTAEDVPDVRAFMREKKHTYPVLYDADGRAHGKYFVSAIPVDFIIDKSGAVLRELRGPRDIDELKELLVQAAK
ncbi:MAG: TlpA family protein disulfide reductase [Myxococcales bacterium]|nr:TlpA family protein disulfide reductase [Myxococcales bacterium]